MNRFNFFFRQKVTEAELDGAFEAVENSMFNLALDWGIVGITSGAEVTENAGTPNMTVDVAGPATIYDQNGQRISWTPTQDIDVSVDENSVSTAVVGGGNEKYLSIFAEFVRVESDARTDGAGAALNFSRAEGFSIGVVQGAEAGAGTATPPALEANRILLADVLIAFGTTSVVNADIDTDRRQWAFKTTSGTAIGVGQAEAAIQILADAVSGGSTGLASQVAPTDGATLVGVDAIADSPSSTTQDTLKAVLVELLGLVNDRVTLAGADTITAVKTLGSGGSIDLPSGGGLITGASGRAREDVLISDARNAGSGGAILNGEAGKVQVAIDDDAIMVLVNCVLDSTANTYIATATGSAYKIEIGIQDLNDSGGSPNDIGSGFKLSTKTSVTSGVTTWTTWDRNVQVSGASQTDRSGAFGLDRLITPNAVAAGLLRATLDTGGGGSFTDTGGFGLASAGTPTSIAGSSMRVAWEQDAPAAADQITVWHFVNGGTGGFAHAISDGHSGVGLSEGRLYDATGTLISPTGATGTYFVTATRFILGD